ncbi:MAG: TetR/AcrR family transcriptional regulator [Acidimicrobiales bacterium]|nr:TetR/AcrR family transcriptional regulator [Acidimicrobiales bacterium]
MTRASSTETRPRLPASVRRQQLLEVALERFAAGGYRETSMDDIAIAAGVTKPVLYQHFQSKEQLFRELLDSVGRDLIHAVTSAAEAGTGPYHRVLAGFRAYFEFVCKRPSAFQLMLCSGARLSEEFAGPVRRLEEEMAAAVNVSEKLSQNPREGEGGDSSSTDSPLHSHPRDGTSRRLLPPRSSFATASEPDLVGFAIVGLAEVTARRWIDTAGARPLDPREAVRLATDLADLVWAGMRDRPAWRA